jgi:hypothetical protein
MGTNANCFNIMMQGTRYIGLKFKNSAVVVRLSLAHFKALSYAFIAKVEFFVMMNYN